MQNKAVKTRIVLITGIVAVSFAATFVRLADAPSAVVAALRLVFASLIMAPLALGSARTRQELGDISGRDAVMIIMAGTFLFLHFTLWISSLYFTGVANSVVLVTTSPIFITLYSVLFFRERVGGLFWLGLAISIGGAFILGWSNIKGGGFEWKGDVLALSGAVSVAGYFLIGSRLRKRLSLLSYIFPVYSVSAVLLAGTAVVFGYSLAGWHFDTYLYCFLMAVVCQLIGHSSFNWALKRLKAPIATTAIIGEPVGASLIAYVILNEAPSGLEIAGGAVILAGLFVILSRKEGIR